MTNPALAINNLSMAFQPEQYVLREINLTLEPGSVTGLLGKNGAGKTTLMRAALGLLRPTSGEATLFSEPAWNASKLNRSRIGYVAQADAPFYWMRTSDCLNLVSSFYKSWDDTLVNRYLSEWDLDPSAFIQDLSQGQRQKVSILTAIGHRPDLLVLDEPVASLDPGARRQFLKALVELNQDLDRTILFSTHITSDVERVVADVVVLHDGGVRFRGDLDDLREGCQRLYFTGEGLPETLVEADIERYEMSDNRAVAFAKNWSRERTRALSESLGVVIESEELALEELFLELTHD